jgi:hypothetical protein
MLRFQRLLLESLLHVENLKLSGWGGLQQRNGDTKRIICVGFEPVIIVFTPRGGSNPNECFLHSVFQAPEPTDRLYRNIAFVCAAMPLRPVQLPA